jgi:adenosylhomocysteinase
LINLAAAEGHPSEVMDMSFANQYLALCQLAKKGKNLENKVYELPAELDQEIAKIKLDTLGFKIDALTKEQADYSNDYSAGT